MGKAMDDDRLERIRARAHVLWEREGRPEGRAEAHWQQACQELAEEEGPPKKGHRGADIVPDAEHVKEGENPIRRRIRKKATGE
jgi:hypothetical protein